MCVFECRCVCVRVTFVTSVRVCTCMAFAISSERRSVCVALIAIAGRRYTYTVCTNRFSHRHASEIRNDNKKCLMHREHTRGQKIAHAKLNITAHTAHNKRLTFARKGTLHTSLCSVHIERIDSSLRWISHLPDSRDLYTRATHALSHGTWGMGCSGVRCARTLARSRTRSRVELLTRLLTPRRQGRPRAARREAAGCKGRRGPAGRSRAAHTR